jgi:hypothetical protein
MKADLGQSINVADNKEFCEFALFGRDDVTDADLPHRTKLTELINNEYESRHAVLVKELAVHFQSRCIMHTHTNYAVSVIIGPYLVHFRYME